MTGYEIADLVQKITEQVSIFDVLDMAHSGVLAVIPDGTIVWANAQIHIMFLYSAKSLIGKNMLIIIPPDVRAKHDKHVSTYLHYAVGRRMGTGLGKLHGLRQGGEEFEIEVNLKTQILEGITKIQKLTFAFVRDLSIPEIATDQK